MTRHRARIRKSWPNVVRLALGFWLVLVAGSQAPARSESTARVRAVDVSGREYEGALAAWQAGVVTIVGRMREQPPRSQPPDAQVPERFALSTEDLVSLRFVADRSDLDPAVARESSRVPMIVLENGDRLVLRSLSLSDEQLVAEPTGRSSLPALRIPFETVRGAVLNPAATAAAQDKLLVRVLEPHSQDEVLLMNGKSVAGELVDFGNGRFVVRSAVGELDVAAEEVRSISMNSELISFPPAGDSSQLIGLADGSWLTAREVGLSESGERLHVEAAFGGEFEVALDQVTSIRFWGRKVTALSDLEPAEYQNTPFLSLEWPLVRNASVTKRPLRLRGVTYPRGLGMHSASRVRYQLDGGYARFSATIGIDDDAPRGAAVFAVEVDGKRVFESSVLTGADAAIKVGPLNIEGAGSLSLVVEYGTGADVQDHADWCDPVLIRGTDEAGTIR